MTQLTMANKDQSTKTKAQKLFHNFSGDFVDRVTPVPIPNTEVKPVGADGTARVTVWESRKSPGLLAKARESNPRGLFSFAATPLVQPSHSLWAKKVTKSSPTVHMAIAGTLSLDFCSGARICACSSSISLSRSTTESIESRYPNAHNSSVIFSHSSLSNNSVATSRSEVNQMRSISC